MQLKILCEINGCDFEMPPICVTQKIENTKYRDYSAR